jgi:hypothetical protein
MMQVAASSESSACQQLRTPAERGRTGSTGHAALHAAHGRSTVADGGAHCPVPGQAGGAGAGRGHLHDQIVAANQWLGQNGALKGDILQAAEDKQPDVSVKSLTMFPAVLSQMAANPTGPARWETPSSMIPTT